jgi:hypothetical protein
MNKKNEVGQRFFYRKSDLCLQTIKLFFSQKEGLDEVIHDKRSVIHLIDLNAKQIENKI